MTEELRTASAFQPQVRMRLLFFSALLGAASCLASNPGSAQGRQEPSQADLLSIARHFEDHDRSKLRVIDVARVGACRESLRIRPTDEYVLHCGVCVTGVAHGPLPLPFNNAVLYTFKATGSLPFVRADSHDRPHVSAPESRSVWTLSQRLFTSQSGIDLSGHADHLAETGTHDGWIEIDIETLVQVPVGEELGELLRRQDDTVNMSKETYLDRVLEPGVTDAFLASVGGGCTAERDGP